MCILPLSVCVLETITHHHTRRRKHSSILLKMIWKWILEVVLKSVMTREEEKPNYPLQGVIFCSRLLLRMRGKSWKHTFHLLPAKRENLGWLSWSKTWMTFRAHTREKLWVFKCEKMEWVVPNLSRYEDRHTQAWEKDKQTETRNHHDNGNDERKRDRYQFLDSIYKCKWSACWEKEPFHSLFLSMMRCEEGSSSRIGITFFSIPEPNVRRDLFILSFFQIAPNILKHLSSLIMLHNEISLMTRDETRGKTHAET